MCAYIYARATHTRMHTTNLAAKLIKIFELYKFICKFLQTILFLTQNQGKRDGSSPG